MQEARFIWVGKMPPGEANGNPLQCSCLGNPMDRGAWWVTVHRIGLWYAIKSGFYTTTSNDQLSGWTEKLQSTSQSQTCIKKGHGHCLVVCCPSDPPQLSESQQNNYTWEVCSVNWWNSPKTAMPAASTGEQIGPKNYSLQPCLNAQCTTDTSEVEQEKKKKLNESGNEVLPYLPY